MKFDVPVHPRVCGEQYLSEAAGIFVPGSSPRVRGTAKIDVQLPRGLRFIPACAGNSSARQKHAVISPVHPRVCGEQAAQHAYATQPAGSSPRVRGTEEALICHTLAQRFIPACAGNSRSTR